MDGILNRLRDIGVHYVKSDEQIMLEMLEENVNQAVEIDRLIGDLFTAIENSNYKKVLLECSNIQSVHLSYTKSRMKPIGERVIYKRNLKNKVPIGMLDYSIWSFTEKKSVSFLSEVMGRDMADTEKFVNTMKSELPSQVQRMFTVYTIKNEPVGVVFPHLEPGKVKEGRIFWIGVHPEFRGKGLGRNLHLIGLHRLQNDFKATTYLGATQMNNHPMRKVMKRNGCTENKDHVISLEYSRS